jgi:hypothetical protein
VKNQERSRWLKERWKGGEKGSDMSLSPLGAAQDDGSRQALQGQCQALRAGFISEQAPINANKRE